ncbi:hypothetical protein PHYBLDRAFT_139915 [Phycomyces blakesleeanus NRRL 1555(-)]|uniref:Uncharacterized protein n=1 Tax=Phycomyces blakesleeanus (strain ATCC 8743b / DSM 1359 / FGSC 10004 / NBRC 33097 / NRRL 1555) TaxID=763407 RepID=A0A167QM21_PHYB8|nr:hypothetical protein PHYBLDRAFT_139915 [Phycomyces blakesleeanus NRRL 1555(-)]OAD79904.1 hypothetical protein PHYBLDRAFT_139915 [Phycomyces blakesleeanus NRRL 1555(-)]|eukprot:XP_018297944.1 hypothetical protein PHYBLDRAFT_139915 [Phycomyces blakesleeanus NRRL 1555(-)]
MAGQQKAFLPFTQTSTFSLQGLCQHTEGWGCYGDPIGVSIDRCNGPNTDSSQTHPTCT